MTTEKAIEILKGSTSVEDWNNKMTLIKQDLPKQDIAKIEMSGLIVKVLGRDRYDTRTN